MKKIFALIAAAVAASAILPAVADTWTDPSTGIEWTYTVSGNEATIYKGTSEPAIPESTSGAISSTRTPQAAGVSVRTPGPDTALFSVALKLLGAGANESPEFEIMGETVKLVKGGDGKLTAIVGTCDLATNVKLKYTVQDLVDRKVNPADGRLHVHKYNWMERMDAETALGAMDKLADTASAWRKILADSTPGAGAADADLPLDTGNSGFMQV